MMLFRHARAAALGGAFLVAAVLTGCGPDRSMPPVGRLWPPAPAPPRLKLVQIIRGARDLGKPSFFDALRDAAVGGKDQSLFQPQSVAVAGDERLFVTDIELRGVHVLDLKSGRGRFIATAAGEPLSAPVAVAVCGDLLAVADSARKQVFLFKHDGTYVRALSKEGGFQRPVGLAYDAARKQLYVVDTLANEVCVFDLAGRLVRTFGSRGEAAGQFNYPTYAFVDAGGRLFVTDSLNYRVQVFDASGAYLFMFGKHGDATGHLGMPKGVAVDSLGHIYIADSYFSVVHVFDEQGTFLLDIGENGRESGQFNIPTGLAVGPEDRIYVCDSKNRRIQVLQYVGARQDVQPPADR